MEEAEVAGHEWPEGVAGGGAVAANDEGHIRDHAERPGARAPGSARRLTHAPHVRGRGEDSAVDAVGDLAGQAQSLRPLDAEEDRHVARWRGLEGDAVHGEALAAEGQPLARKEPPDDLDALAHRLERRRERDAHPLLDPDAIAGTQAEHHAPGRQARERRGLHRQQRRVPRVGVHHADPDDGALGDGRRGAGEREGAGIEVVLDEPDTAESRTLRGACPAGHVPRRVGPEKRDAEAIGEAQARSSRGAPRAACRSRRRRRAPPAARCGSPPGP